MTLPSSYRKANSHEDGPFRKVVDVVCHPRTGRPCEVLECGHQGAVLHQANWATPRKKRRCMYCRDGRPPHQDVVDAPKHPKREHIEGVDDGSRR